MSPSDQISLNQEVSKTIGSAEPHTLGIGLSLTGLILALAGLGLAAIPNIAMERAIINPFETPEEAQRKIEGPPLRQGGVAFKIKGFEIRFGGKEVKNPAAPPKPVAVTSDPLRWFMIAACVFGMTGLAVSAVAQVREEHTAINCVAMTCSVAAITWQFAVFGIILGVAAAIFLTFVRFWL